MHQCLLLSALVFTFTQLVSAIKPNIKPGSQSNQQILNTDNNDWDFGQSEPFHPTPQHILPGKTPFYVNETVNYHQKFYNGSENGFYRRSSCPAINILANRGYINRSGRNITYSELAHAVRRVWNFGDDNVSLDPPDMFLHSEHPLNRMVEHACPRTDIRTPWVATGY